MAQGEIQYGAGTIEINVVTVNTRCVDISVDDNLCITMKVPVGMHQDMVEKYIQINKQKILQEYEKKKNRNHQALAATMELENGRIVYRSGQRLPFLGDMKIYLRVKYLSDGGETQLYVDEDVKGMKMLTIRTNDDTQEFLRYCVMRYYRKCTTDIVTKKALYFGKEMNLGFKNVQVVGAARRSRPVISRFSYKNIEISDQKTLWGSCNRKRYLKFDWKLSMLPVEIIDYIIVHELTHLKKMNHSQAFWSEMEKVMPEYSECREWLNKHGKEYEIF